MTCTDFDVFDRPLPRVCIECLGVVQEFPWGFECRCGCSFVLDLLYPSVTVGEPCLLVAPAVPEPVA